jgi:hypothetical protein
MDAGEPRWVAYEPAVVTLTGRLVEKEFFGPPNFGEDPDTDSRVVRLLLVLDEPVNVRGNARSELNSDDALGVREVQLREASAPRVLLGRHVSARGTLSHAIAPLEFTEVLLEVARIEPIE